MPHRTLTTLAHVTALLLSLAPSLGLFAIPKPPFAGDDYFRYRELWGGSPFEVYSHFLDLVLMTGNLAAISGMLLLECSIRRLSDDPVGTRVTLRWYSMLGLALSGAFGTALDTNDGEGAVVIVFWLAFLPILVGAQHLLWTVATRVDWHARKVSTAAILTTGLGGILQLVYEPSQTGAPSWLFLPIWLGGPPALVYYARSLRRPLASR